jgi:phage portal protein BeeE
MSFEKLTMTNEDSQFLQTRAFQVIEICRLFGVPPHKIYDLSKSAFSTLEQQDQAYANESIKPRTVNICGAYNMRAFYLDERGKVRLRIDHSDMLQGDMKARAEYYGSTVNNGLLCRNEARARLGFGPVPGGELFRVPANTALLEADGTLSPDAAAKAAAADAKINPKGLGSDVMSDKTTGDGAAPIENETADQTVA